MSHNYHHQDPAFSYSQHHPPAEAPQPISLPPSQQQPRQPSVIKPPRKAKRCRKRYPPVGPAGIWFLSRTGSKNKINGNNSRANASSQDSTESSSLQQPFVDDDDDDADEGSALHNNSANSVGSNPAWVAMQYSLQWLTPDVSPSSAAVAALSSRGGRRRLLTPLERYQKLRPHVPNEFILLPQLQYGNCSTCWKLPKGQKLVVLVHAIACHHDDIWTVELHDDTGSSIQAWIQPSFVQTERQRSSQDTHGDGPQYIRPGYVWCLEDVTVMLQQSLSGDDDQEIGNNCQFQNSHGEAGSHPDSSSSGTAKRMLLISQRNVLQVWKTDACQQIDETEYVRWMEQRDAFQRQWEEEYCRHQEQLSTHGNNQSTTVDSRRENGNIEHVKQDDDDSEEEDDEDFYRRSLQHRTSHYTNRGDDDDEEGNVIGGPKIVSLHANSSMASTNRSLPNPSQHQHQNHNTEKPSQATTTRQRPPSTEDEEQENESTAILTKTLIESLYSSTTRSSQHTPQADQPYLRQRPDSDGQPHPSQQQNQPQYQLAVSKEAQPYQGKPSREEHRANLYARQLTNHAVSPGVLQQQPQQRGLQHQVITLSNTCSQLDASFPVVNTTGARNQQYGVSPPLPLAAQEPTNPDIAFDKTKRDANKSRRVSFSQVPPSMQKQKSSTPETYKNILQDRKNRQNLQSVNNHETFQQKEPLQKNKSVNLSQFSASSTSQAPKSTDASGQKKGQHTELKFDESKNDSPTSIQECDKGKTPPKHCSKDGNRTKYERKKARYDTSPLSHVPRPDVSKLWTTTFPADMSCQLGASFLALSSDEDDNTSDIFDHIASNRTKQSVEKDDAGAHQDPKSVDTADTTCTSPLNSNTDSSSGGGGRVAALFQATFMPSVNWANPSDDEDDD